MFNTIRKGNGNGTAFCVIATDKAASSLPCYFPTGFKNNLWGNDVVPPGHFTHRLFSSLNIDGFSNYFRRHFQLENCEMIRMFFITWNYAVL